MATTEKDSFTTKYLKLTEKLSKYTEITQSKKSGFGSGIRINGKVFAMPSKGKLVIKLSHERITELIDLNEGEPYIHSGKLTKGWMVVVDEKNWERFAIEALNYVIESAK